LDLASYTQKINTIGITRLSNQQLSLEKQLLAEPFNHEIRQKYAESLLAAEAFESAAMQFKLIISQQPELAHGYLGLARALLALGNQETALQKYEEARDLPGFSAIEALESVDPSVSSPQTPRLTLVSDRQDENILPFAQPNQDRVGFNDIAGLDDLKRTVRLQIIEPFLKPGLFARFKKKAGGGVLLYGPPGCGKTMIARAIATECRAEFISVGISDVLNMYIGESERNLAAIFAKARQTKPCVLFFDEIDALAYSRSKAKSESTRQIVNEFLAQLDGFGSDNQEVLILAATNMPWDVDSAMKRPGRFSKQVFVQPPDIQARSHIISLKLKDVPHDEIKADDIAELTPHFSGADIDGVVELAKDYVLEEHIGGNDSVVIKQQDLERAAKSSRASTLDWLRTARNLIKYAGADDSYSEVEKYLKKNKLL
jgi:SpoVK/Ycf46/Vps4 family AAA+-type ATPase